MNFANLFHNEPNPRCYLAGETVIQAGEPHKEMLVLLDGEAEVLVGDRVVETEKPGSLFGEMALLGTREARATVRARTDISVAVVDERRFLFLVQQTPFFGLHVMRVLVERIRAMHHALS